MGTTSHSARADQPTLFVWRGARLFDERLPNYCETLSFSTGSACPCPFCDVILEAKVSRKGTLCDDIALSCNQCGFHSSQTEDWIGLGSGMIGMGDAYPASVYEVACLKTLELNSADLALGELGSHLRRNVSDIYALTPQRFEVVVADVFRNLGYHAQLTKQTRDGGYDVLLSSASGQQVLVECKRYVTSRRVCVSVVRELLGVQLQLGVPFGKIVTSGHFTEPARSTAIEMGMSRRLLKFGGGSGDDYAT